MNKQIKILLVDDDEEDYLITKEILSEVLNGNYHLDWVSSYDEGKSMMKLHQHDVYLVDYRLGSMIGLELIKDILDHGFDKPLILLTGFHDREIDLAAQKVGAADYLVKNGLTPETLDRSIRYCIKQYEMLIQIKEINKTLEVKVAQRTQELEKSKLDLQNALLKEKELNELKSRFLTTASHEFRTPLGAILSSSSLIAIYNKPEDVSNREKHLHKINFAVAYLTEILNSFNSIEKIKEGKVVNHPIEFDITKLLGEINYKMELITKPEQKININNQLSNSTVMLDKELLKDILTNLIANAIKYSEENTVVLVTVKSNGKELIFSVKDEGVGIPEADQKHIFETFYRASNIENIQGTGMGLNIIKKHLQIMNGRIEFESSLGNGSCFTISFPINKKH